MGTLNYIVKKNVNKNVCRSKYLINNNLWYKGFLLLGRHFVIILILVDQYKNSHANKLKVIRR